MNFNVKILAQNPHLKKITQCGFPKLTDYQCFNYSIIKHSENPFNWKISENYNQFDPPMAKLSLLHLLGTTAFLVIKNDTIIYEKYFLGFNKQTQMNSFSVAKSITAILVGIAIREGYIKSLDDKVKNYIKQYPTLFENKGKNLTIRHLLTMTSGSSWTENFLDPLSDVVTAYYGENLDSLLENMKITSGIGKKWKYQCGNTILLGLVIENASGMKLPDFAEKYLWKPLGANYDAFWNKDTNNITKAFCCFYATARDFALLGYLLLNNGKINGQTILPNWYVKEMVKPYKKADYKLRKVDFYGLHTWIYPKKKYDFYYMAGMFGQYIIVFPLKKLIIVRFGEMPNQLTIRRIPPDLETYVNIGLKIAKIYDAN